jgi:copper(I)-binding protein
MSPTVHRRSCPTRIRRSAAALVAAAVAAGTAACSAGGPAGADGSAAHTPRTSASSALPTGTSVTSGDLTVTGAYVRKPASPDVAAAYLTIRNDGDRADRLVRATADVSAKVMPMTEKIENGVGTMVDIPVLIIPAHGSAELLPGKAHLMMYDLTRELAAGEKVTVTLTFAHAATVTIRLSVVEMAGTTRMSHMPAMTPGTAGMPVMSGTG